MNPSPMALASSLSSPTPLTRSSLEMAEYLEDWIDLEEGRIKGGILV